VDSPQDGDGDLMMPVRPTFDERNTDLPPAVVEAF